MENLKIGMVGIGLMGIGIASNIVKAGLALSFLHHEGNQPTDDLVSNGGNAVNTARELASDSDIIILCVTGSPQVEAILTQEGGLLDGLKPNSVIIDCSTAIPSSTKNLAAKVTKAGGRFVDAPMTRTPKEAMEGRLNLIVGGTEADFNEVLPVLQTFAENISHVGEIGAGHSMKLLHNYVSLGFAVVLSEAAASAELGGIDPERFVDVLAKGGGGGVVLDRLKPYIMNNDPSGLKFSISNACKDMGYYNQMAGDLCAANPVAQSVLKLLEEQVNEGDGQTLMPELIKLLQK